MEIADIDQGALAQQIMEWLDASKSDARAKGISIWRPIYYALQVIGSRIYGRIRYWADRLNEWLVESTRLNHDIANIVQLMYLFCEAFEEKKDE